MDTMKFDTLSRTLSGATTRRDALRTFAAIGLSLGLGHAGLELAAAKSKKGKGKKKKLGDRCSSKDTCAGGLQCKVSNSQNSCYPTSEQRCCKPTGASCDNGCECCGVDVICNGGYCQQA